MIARTLTLVLAPSLASGQCEAELVAPDSVAWDDFGAAVALEDDTAVVGAPGDTEGGVWSGSVYVFTRAGGVWSFAAKLTPADPSDFQYFGAAVALHGDTLVVGAPYDSTLGKYAGSAYVFVRGGASWSQEAKLTASNAMAFQNFGQAVAIEGDRAVVGAPIWSEQIGDSGWAFVYERAAGAWSESAVLDTPDDYNASFGQSLALRGDRLAVGAPQTDGALQFECGATYVFDESGGTWSQTDVLAPAALVAGSWFGSALAFDGAWLVVGAQGWSDAGSGAGAAYVFEDSGGVLVERARILAEDSQNNDRFGAAVALSQGRVWVGAPGEDGSCGWDCRRGKVYRFEDRGTGWGQLATLVSSNQGDIDFFGAALAADGDDLLCGAYNHGGSGNNKGAAYVYGFSPLGTSYCDANANSTGLRAAISATGSPVLDDNCLLLVGAQLPQDQFGYFLTAGSTDFVPYFAGSRGNLCLGAPIVRFAADVLDTGDAGLVSLRPDLTDLPQGTVFLPGETRYFQLWFRDNDPGPTSNTTDGLAVTWQ